MKDEMKQLTMVTHRCNSIAKLRDESTYRFAEVDVHQCADGTIVCRHSHKYNGKNVKDIPYEIGMGPTLDSMVRAANVLGKALFVEIKDVHSSKPDSYEQKVLDIVAKADWPVVILSFSARVLTTIHMLDRTVPLVINSKDGTFSLSNGCIEKMCKGVCIRQADLASTNVHEFPIYLYETTGPIPEGTLSGIAGIIK